MFSCDKFKSYIIDSRVKVHTDHDGLKKILERTDVKPRLIRWILLLQEFELQIVQRKEEEQLEEVNKVQGRVPIGNVSTIYIPPGTSTSKKKPPFCARFGGIKVKHYRRR